MMQSRKIGIEQFWLTLRASELVPAAQIEQLFETSTSLGHTDCESLVAWLMKQGAITPLHGEVLKSGHAGPFDFGRYRILSQSFDKQVWEGRDRKTGHLVWLHFFPGQSSGDLTRWDRLEQRLKPFESIKHPNLLRIYECVATPKYRFVASARSEGKLLSERMPLKRRLEEEQALSLLLPIAAALAEVEAAGGSHGSLSLDHVLYRAKSGVTRVLPPLMPTDFVPNSETNDVVAMGRILFRVLSGRDAANQSTVAKMEKQTFAEPLIQRKVGEAVCELIYDAVAREGLSAGDFFEQLNQISSDSFEAQRGESIGAAELEFVAGLLPWSSDEHSRVDGEPVPEVDEEISAPPDEALVEYRKKKLPVALSLGFSLLAFAACLLAVGYVASRKTLDPSAVAVIDSETEIGSETGDPAAADRASDSDPAAESTEAAVAVDAEIPNRRQLVGYVQTLIEDDQQTLWESPTTGPPIDIGFVPPVPRILAAINWSSLYRHQRGQQTLLALGPAMGSELIALESRVGFPLPEIESTIISLHSTLDLEYQSCVLVRLVNPASIENCLRSWGQTQASSDAEGLFVTASGTAYWIAEKSEDGRAECFLCGPSELVKLAAAGEFALATGTLRNLIQSSDADRDLNLIMPTIALFNTEGQTLLANHQSWANELRFALPASARGLALSLDLDDGDYLEVHVDHSGDLNESEMVMEMRRRTQSKLMEVSAELDQRQALPFWEPLRNRFGAMVRELQGQLRWGSEFDRVAGNVWLPPGAFHNLFAATELAMTFEPAKQGVASVKPKMPQTLRELLETRRDLTIANPPDLNVLLKNIREEVSDQYLGMPFKFRIEIAAADLQKEGITQNQRPAPLEIEDKSLSEILTQVMVSANPSRDITGAADANCKLVWVLDEDPASGESYVMVTTRAAAAAKGFQLPAAFVVQP